MEQLRRLGGTPPDVLDNAELLDIVLPIVRADFELIEKYRSGDDVKLRCPVCAIGGDDDPDVGAATLEGWRETTADVFETMLFPGGHFYINKNTEALVSYVAERLLCDAV